MRILLIWPRNILFGLILLLTVIVAAEWILSRVCVNTRQAGGPITIFLLSNGVHTDIVMPVKNAMMNWDRVFPVRNTVGRDTTLAYLGIGWGDKGFYLETPTWADLKVSTALRAMTGLSSSALHCTYMSAPVVGKKCVALQISEAQYQRLIAFVLETAQLDPVTRLPVLIPTEAVYSRNDAFYDAYGSYHLFNTCNTWTNTALKKAKLKAAVWLLFEKQLIEIYK